ncbi:MAG: NAD(P)/FAD-dependent oxidoreductase [Rhodobiaceae bacterium]|nr:NAD(P)/FAD-dependent oxidoreductase [Rhodobiaceae bacterium]MCC0057395.1 NAD(P)/FAD-dependent oxidoreductase [Rhodobiaceae bacterium]
MSLARQIDAPVEASGAEALDAERPIVIAGGGPVGIRAAQELSRLGYHVVLFNAERWRPYNRVKLTPLLAGEAQIGQIYHDDAFPGPGRVDRYDGASVVDVHREAREVLISTGRIVPYSHLVLALGSRAFIPAIPGADLSGIYAFRNFDDTEALLARSMSARRVVVIGGGLLGLEAARGMSRRGAKVIVVEHESRLMPRQLDEEAGASLKQRIEALGIEVLTGERVASIDGAHRVEAVSLAGGRRINADTVILCTGVRANIQLPSAIGLQFGRGVKVDDEMRSSDPFIYAIGECAEHNEIVHGLVGPGFEQALAAVASIAGRPVAYQGSTPATKLKVLGADVFSMGDFESMAQAPGVRSHVWRGDDGSYRRIFTERGKLVAALGIGTWPEASQLQERVQRRALLQPWNIWSFRRSGMLWREQEASVSAWPREAIVCNCTGVNKGAIVDAVTLGAQSLEEVRAATSANSVCGTCQPLVMELLGQGAARPEAVRWWKWLVGLSLAAALLGLVTLLSPPIPLSEGFRPKELLRSVWFDSVWKQWSGFFLLGATALAAALGLRRRIGVFGRLGSYQVWRFIHLALGLVAVLLLVWHTGFRLGANLNLLLMASFIVTLIFGAITGLVTGGEHELRSRDLVSASAKPRSLPFWIHVLALWPLPVLLLIHVLSVYTY